MPSIVIVAVGLIFSTALMIAEGAPCLHWLANNPSFLDAVHALSGIDGVQSAGAWLAVPMLIAPCLSVGLIASAALFKVVEFGITIGFTAGMSLRRMLGLLPQPVVSGHAVSVKACRRTNGE